MSRFARRAGVLVAALAAGIILVFAGSSVVYSPTYMLRMALWQDADVDDAGRFPFRFIRSAVKAAPFAKPADPARSRAEAIEVLAASEWTGGDARGFLERTQTQAFIVIRDGVLLLEWYPSDYARESTLTSFSVTKSFVSALVGIAVDEGAIRTIDDPITAYLPELLDRDPRFAEITVRDLLNMTSGLRYDETGFVGGDDSLTYYFDDLRALALERSAIAGPPAVEWRYNNYNPLLLGLILERATGMSVAGYLEDRLWTRMGTAFPASWSLDHDNGFEKMESGINATAIDFARLGQLYLDGGRSGEEQVVPAAWVHASTDGAIGSGLDAPGVSRSYGSVSHELYWWQIERPNREPSFSAYGNLGQFVFVSPADRLVIARFGRSDGGLRAFDWFEVFTTVADQLGPLP